LIIALATPRVASSIDEGLRKIEQCLADAVARGAEIACFPEAYLPGLRGLDFDVPSFDAAQQSRALAEVAQLVRRFKVATILGTERLTEAGLQIVAVVFNADGSIQGIQTKNQLDPTEGSRYVPGHSRQLFEINGVKFGVAICHEGFRYPVTVRWAAIRGAQVVFHQHCTGSDRTGVVLKQWGSPDAPYYEKAMLCRSLENTIYFASVNYAFRYQQSATTVIGPSGECISYLPYGEEGVLVQTIDPEAATGLLASRYAPERYEEFVPD